jgi:ribonuclease J
MDILKIISLGGFNNVTQNMFVYHFLPGGKEENSQILVVDVGVGFPEEDLFGVDLVVPDFSYVKERQDKIVGIILTHGHEDHIGALPLFLSQIKVHPPILGARLTAAMVNSKLDEFGSKPVVRHFESGQMLSFGRFVIEPIRVTHSIPDTFHFLIKTPVGNFYHGADFKVDLTPIDGVHAELSKISDAGKQGITAALIDCLGSEHPGYSPSEIELAGMFEEQVKSAKGRIFVTAISSNVYRWQQAISASIKFGRRISLVGMSVEKNIRLAQKLGHIKLDEKHLLKPDRIKHFPDKKVTILVGGSLGQTGSSLDKIILGKHRISIKPTDKVIFSSPDYIPGTTSAVYQMIDSLSKKGAEVIYREIADGLHVSGHASRQEIALIMRLLSPSWMIPIGGNYRHMHQFSLLAQKVGFSSSRVLMPETDQVLMFDNRGLINSKVKLGIRKVYVDGLGIGDVGQVVLRDRQQLAKEGVVVIIYLIDSAKNRLMSGPTVISRGFVYLKKSKRLIGEIENGAKKAFEESWKSSADNQSFRKYIQGKVEELIYKKTGRQPMVLPVLIET